MALSCEPQLLIADEPTTALDVTTQSEILDLLGGVVRETDMAVLLITHDLGVVARLADFVYVMYGGMIVEHAPTAAIFKHPSHPYTARLLKATPDISLMSFGAPEAIEGQPPDPADLGPGCPFVDRCRCAVPRCAEQVPSLTERACAGQSAACWIDSGPIVVR
jgi:oligopeptide/dipeptide ABC transporter ATP-binding protein